MHFNLLLGSTNPVADQTPRAGPAREVPSNTGWAYGPLNTGLARVSKMAPSCGCRLGVPWDCQPERLYMLVAQW